MAIIGNTESEKILARRRRADAAPDDAESVRHVIAALGSANLDRRSAASIGQIISSIRSPTRREEAIEVLLSAIREIPMADDVKRSFRPVLEKHPISEKNPRSRFEWLRGLAQASTPAGDKKAYDAFMVDRFRKGSEVEREVLLASEPDALEALTAEEKSRTVAAGEARRRDGAARSRSTFEAEARAAADRP